MRRLTARKIWPKRLGLALRVSLVTMAAVFLSTLLLTMLALQVVKKNMLSGIEADQQAHLTSIARTMDQKLESRRLQLRILAQSIPPEYLSSPALMQQHLRRQPGLKQSFDAVSLVARNGVIVANYNSDGPVGKSIADRAYFKQTLASSTGVISAPLRNRFSGLPQIVMTEVVTTKDGGLLFVITAGIDLDATNFLGELASVRFGKTGYVFVVDENGVTINHPDKSRILNKVSDEREGHSAVGMALRGFEGSIRAINSEGRTALYTFTRSRPANWILGAMHPEHEALSPVASVQTNALVSAFVLSIVIGVIAAWLMHRQLVPLLVLHRRMILAHEGDAEVKEELYRNDEIGDLGRAFRDLMAARRAAKAKLSAEKERLRVTLRSIGDAVITTDTSGHVTYLNLVAERMTGWRDEEAVGLPVSRVFNIVSQNTGIAAAGPVERVLQTGAEAALEEETLLISRNGTQFPIEDSAAPILDEAGRMTGVVLVFHDVTHAKQMAAKMTFQATHDSLTGLINRREFERRLALALESGKVDHKKHSLLYLDLDQFKVVNDTCGHAAGDELLRQLATLLQSRLRQSDTLARLGGDEFGVLLESCPTEPALRVAEGLREIVDDFRFVWRDKVFSVGASIGLVSFSNGGVTLNDVLRNADAACYMAKDGGRNRIHVFSPDDREMVRREGEMTWVGRIRHALDEDRFVLYAQKIVSLQDHGAGPERPHREILLRMNDEKGQLVPPMAFIPAAERYGLMAALDRWVVKHAFRAHQEQRYDGLCAINLSGTSISDPEFITFLRNQIAHFQVNPQDFCFEVTETAAVANLSHAAELIRGLKNMGCKIALDDFGSGMSSFGYLKQLPVDYLKIDGGFVRDMCADKIDHAMVEAIHRIGHVMQIKTIAEFVEDAKTADALRDMGVDFAQGYGIGKPVPLALYS